MGFDGPYEKTVWNSEVLNLEVGFMLKVGGVVRGLERKSQESGSSSEKVLQLRGTGHAAVPAASPFLLELTVSAA